MKKLSLILGAIALTLVALPLFSAFEAHVINVTATIENALSVPIKAIDFGTVFPQEYLKESLGITLSDSFLAENRVDDVDYFIRQKPKCGVTNENGTQIVGPTWTGHVVVGDNPFTTNAVETYYIDCDKDRPVQVLQHPNPEFWLLPSLCEYISKHPDNVNNQNATSTNDGTLPSFHEPFVIQNNAVVWNDTKGHLAKSESDTTDNWIIDLAVPCFGGNCAQDWASFVASHNDIVNADDYVQPIDTEHKMFGCDLWVEVAGISLPPGLSCLEKADVMLVLDRSGSIDSTELATLKTAAKAFVDALALSPSGVHAGELSFASSATLDEHLTAIAQDVKDEIDALTTGGSTNLEDAILDATAELANPGDSHDRADGDSPDFMVIITDGAPTTSNTGGNPADDAAAAAAAAKLAGIEIYVVGVGTTPGTADYLKLYIATDAAHYFDAGDFDDLQAILSGIASCTP